MQKTTAPVEKKVAVIVKKQPTVTPSIARRMRMKKAKLA